MLLLSINKCLVTYYLVALQLLDSISQVLFTQKHLEH